METVELYPSYLPKDALDTMRCRPIDIMIMDIRMPGINGIDMLSRVAKVRPSCKIILLSGYSDFGYAQSAMRYHGCVGYVLKSQGDEVLLAEIRRVMDEIDEEIQKQLLSDSERRFENELLDNAVWEWLSRNGMAEDVKCSLDGSRPVLPILCRFQTEEFISTMQAADAIDSVLESTMTEMPLREKLMLEDGKVLWLFQNADDAQTPLNIRDYVTVALQYTVERLPQIAMNFVSYGFMCPVAEVKDRLRQMLVMPIENDRVQIFDGNPETVEEYLRQIQMQMFAGNMDSLNTLLQEKGFENAYLQNRTKFLVLLLDCVMQKSNADEKIHRLYVNIAGMLLCSGDDLEKFRSIADQCCQWYAPLDNGDRLMQFVLTYIEKHICDRDLSLTNLAMETKYNPVYLSRVIKQKHGKGLLEIINDRRFERAKELLLEGKMSIQEITKQVGFQSASYFTVFFRKRTGMNPSAFLHMANAEKSDK